MSPDEPRSNNRRPMSHNALVLTGFPPGTNFDTPTPSQTPTVAPTVCGSSGNYVITVSQGAGIVPGTTDVGNHTDDGATAINLPFTYFLYGQPFTTANVTSNGQLDFQTADTAFSNACLPDTFASYAIFPHWDDLRTDITGTVPSGIYTSVSGSSPNRIFNIEWRAVYYISPTLTLNFEVRLYEGQGRFDVIYGHADQNGSSATVGVQRDTGSQFTQFECNVGGISSGLMLTFAQPPCGAPTSTPTSTPIPTPTSGSIVGHVVWQGLPAQPNLLQQVPLTMTLKLGATEVNFPRQLTDSSGFFTVTTNLPPGTYNWRVNGNTYLATAGTVVLSSAPVTQVEMGLQPTGDLNGDNLVNAPDFVQLKNNFGFGGAPPIGPDPSADQKK
jgi:hypothetical protein